MNVPVLMRVMTLVTLVVATCIGETKPFSLLIRAPQASVKAGEPIPLEIVLKNTSDKELRVADLAWFYTYSVEVYTSDGQKCHLTPLGLQLDHRPAPSYDAPFGRRYDMVTLKPGNSNTTRMDPHELCEMDELGMYSVRARRKDVLGRGDNSKIESNRFIITITYNPALEPLQRIQ